MSTVFSSDVTKEILIRLKNKIMSSFEELSKEDEDEINSSIWGNIPIENVQLINVDALPTSDIITNAIYLIKKPENEQNENDLYDEYVWFDNGWEIIGTKRITNESIEECNSDQIDEINNSVWNKDTSN